MKPRIYLDVCCLNRAFDDQAQERICIETAAVDRILEWQSVGRIVWVTSTIVEQEVRENRMKWKREALLALLRVANEHVRLEPGIVELAARYCSHGIGRMDALHVAIAESRGCDMLLTTDDGLLRKSGRVIPRLRVCVENPAVWVKEMQP